jgi:AsmA protein
MNARKKAVLLIAAGGAVALVLAGVIVAVSFNLNSFKPRIEAAASRATRLDVKINGKMGLSFFPFGVSARDIHVASEGGEILALDHLRVGVEWLPLLKRQLKVTQCELVKPVITIARDAEGKHGLEAAESALREWGSGTLGHLTEFTMSEGVLAYLDQKTGEKTELKDMSLAIKDLSVPEIPESRIGNISFTGELGCKEVRKGDLEIHNVKSQIKAEKGVISLVPLTMDIFGSKGEGNATAEMSDGHALYRVNLKVPKLDFEKLEESFGTEKVIGGNGDLEVALTMKERENRTLLGNMDGALSLRGDQLIIYAMDLDKVLSSYETSQQFNLADLGAFLIAGPFGSVVLKGYDWGAVYGRTQGGQGTITQFVSHWQIQEGVAEATDCALATPHHRVALKGKLDLVEKQYREVVVALLDDKGCARFEQSVNGSFDSPQVGAVKAMESLAGPILNLYGKAKRFLQGDRCDIFYSGSVQQPPN